MIFARLRTGVASTTAPAVRVLRTRAFAGYLFVISPFFSWLFKGKLTVRLFLPQMCVDHPLLVPRAFSLEPSFPFLICIFSLFFPPEERLNFTLLVPEVVNLFFLSYPDSSTSRDPFLSSAVELEFSPPFA